MNKMKKLLSILSVVILLTGCNKQILDFDYDYDKAVCNYNGEKFTLEIDTWTDYDGEQLQIKSNSKTYLLSANNCYLIKEN